LGVVGAQASAQPPGGALSVDAVVGAGGATSIHGGEFAQPVAFQPVHQSAQQQHPRGRLAIGQRVEVLGGQVLDRSGEAVEPTRLLYRICVRCHGRSLPHPITNARTNLRSVGLEVVGAVAGPRRVVARQPAARLAHLLQTFPAHPA